MHGPAEILNLARFDRISITLIVCYMHDTALASLLEPSWGRALVPFLRAIHMHGPTFDSCHLHGAALVYLLEPFFMHGLNESL